MVHALLESWRILRWEGALIDLRPLHSDRAVELLVDNARFVPGMVRDITDGADDIACAKAIDHVVDNGHFILQGEDSFEFNVYWDNLADFSAYAEEKWLTKRRLSPEVLERAQRIIVEIGNRYRIRIGYTMHLAVYRKRKALDSS
jgi:hypothetical protein